MRTASPTLLLCALGLARLTAQAPITDTLLVDVNTEVPANGLGSDPRPVGEHAGKVWFSAATHQEGRELWWTDGTPANTTRLADLFAGLGHSHPTALAGPDSVRTAAGVLLFRADSDTVGRELFSTDLNTGAVQLVRDIDPNGDGDPEAGVEWNGEVWFLADDGTHGVELWRTDGTTAGTRLGEDVTPGPVSGMARTGSLLVAGGRLWWSTFGGNPSTLWVKDSPSSPARALAPLGGYQSGSLNGAEVPGGGIVFPSSDSTHGDELWFSDGTSQGTVRITDLEPGTGDSSPIVLGSNGTLVFFSADTRALGRELFVTDGTTAGTRLVDDLYTGGLDGVPSRNAMIDPASGDLIFVGASRTAGREPWRSDGTAAGTRVLADIEPGLGSSEPQLQRIRGRKLYLRARRPLTGREFYRIDLSAQVFRRLTDVAPGPDDSVPLMLGWTSLGPLLTADDGSSGREPWVVEIPQVNVRSLGDLLPGPLTVGSEPEDLFRWRDLLFFSATTPAGRSQPWVTDGTVTGTRWLGNSAIDTAHSQWLPLGRTREGVVFVARPTGRGDDRRLWVSDGTVQGTRLVPPFDTGSPILDPTSSAEFGESVLFTENSIYQVRLWRTDGTAAGTSVIATLPRGDRFTLETTIPGVGVVATGGNTATGTELYFTDGTPAGTGPLVELNPGAASSSPRGITAFADGRGAVFSAQDGVRGAELWFTDGTANGTRLVADLEPGAAGSAPTDFCPVGDKIAFVANTTAFGPEVWVTDGTTAGTTLLLDSAPGNQTLRPTGLTTAGPQRMWFWTSVQSGSLRWALWLSNGSIGGTRLVATTTPAGRPLTGRALYAFGDGGQVVLTQDSPTLGEELWLADGTTFGLRPLTDSNPGQLDADPFTGSGTPPVVQLGDRLVFVASDYLHGRELHAVTFAQADGPWSVRSYGRGCGLGIDATGAPALGQSFTILVDAGVTRTPVSLLFGLERAFTEVAPGCDLQLATPISLTSTLSDPMTGTARITIPVPNLTALLGNLLHFQALAPVPGGPFQGVAAGSPGLEVVLGR